MELKLFSVGIAMWLYAFGTRYLVRRKALEQPAIAAVWNSVFSAFVFFLVMLVAAVSSQTRNPVTTVYSISRFQLIIWILAVIGGAVWSYFKHYKDTPEASASVLAANREWSETLAMALVLASVIMFFFLQAFKIPSASMRPTLEEGDHLFVNKIKYGIHIPFTHKRVIPFNKVEKKDVVVFDFPSASPAEVHCGGVQYSKEFIKRVVGMPGDTVEVRDGVLLVNGKPVQGEEDYIRNSDENRVPPPAVNDDAATYQALWEKRDLGRKYGERLRDTFGPVTVPQNNYFVMGDNRDHSCDSRFWGPVPDNSLKGSGWFIYWPPARMKGIR